MNRYWFPSARELRLIQQYARSTSDTPEKVAGYFNAPVEKVRDIMLDARRAA